MTAQSSFGKAFERLALVEGGFVNDPDDPGGATKWGVTEFEARAYGYQGRMEDMTKADALMIYFERFWIPLALPEVLSIAGETLAERLFDAAVNCGRSKGASFLQLALNELGGEAGQRAYPLLDVDGAVGPLTLRALRAYRDRRGGQGIAVLTRTVNCLQGAFYIELGQRNDNQRRFTFGRMRSRIA